MTKLRSGLQEGFTLVEILITVSVVSIVFGIIANFAIDALDQSSVNTARADMLGQTQITMDQAIEDIRLAAGVEINNKWPDVNNPNGQYAWQSNADTLVLKTVAVDSSKNIIYSDPALYVTEKDNTVYFVKDSKLYKRVLASPAAGNTSKTTCPAPGNASCPPDKLMLENVSGFTVKYLDSNGAVVAPQTAQSVELNIKTSIIKFKQNITSDYTTRAVFRND